jgi:acid phosphatase
MSWLITGLRSKTTYCYINNLGIAINHCVSLLHRYHSTEPFNATSFNAYVKEGSALALPETQRLFMNLISLGIKPVFLTGRAENQRAITVVNLRRQGYYGWMELLLKPVGFEGTAIGFKSGERRKLQDAGYVIVGNIGDQWSDILGAPEGARTFKLPDPLYYIA